ncbi:uncharacterized protein LOC143198066 isoform X1 [Rhynchophorus ferrugineus]|uniref:uncharacterized protein LOC143198066 isoform X1 n=2 Tax=Rhynchophorus ferrugineus TaxID=354439 RepID=UPI003FCD9E79
MKKLNMDQETGEMAQLQMSNTDPETGENETLSYSFNKETGEKENHKSRGLPIYSHKQNTFKINRPLVRISSAVRRKNMKRNSDDISTNFTALVFLLPTVVFTPIFGFVILSFGVILHKWCHRQNAKLICKGEDSIYYQSPFHALYKEFCSKCIAEEECKKMCKIQRMRYNKRQEAMKESLRRVV